MARVSWRRKGFGTENCKFRVVGDPMNPNLVQIESKSTMPLKIKRPIVFFFFFLLAYITNMQKHLKKKGDFARRENVGKTEANHSYLLVLPTTISFIICL